MKNIRPPVQPNPRGGPREWSQDLLRDEAHFRADADLRGKWVLKGEAALVDSTSSRGEKACYYSGVCLETGEVEAMEIAGNSNAETSTAFLQQLRANHPGPLVVIWDNGPAHRGAAIRSYLTTPDLHLRLVALPAYSPDQRRRSRLGLGQRRGHGQRMPRNKSQSPREDESILRRANSS